MPLHSENAIASSSQNGSEVLKRSIGASTRSKILLEAKERKGLTIFNHSPSALYVDFGSSVSINDFAVKLPPGAYYEMPYSSPVEVRGIWEQGQGKALIREFV